MPLEPRPDPRARESRDTLDRVRRDSETFASSSLARAGRRVGDHFADRDAEGQEEGGGTDPVEVWGRRVGRVLSLLLGVALTWWLGVQLSWW